MDIYELAFLRLDYKYGIVIYAMPCARISKDIIDFMVFSQVYIFSHFEVSLLGVDFNLSDYTTPAAAVIRFESRPFLH